MAGRPPPPTFAGMKPPPGYVAGLGRGATGFTTRSDIGPGAPAPPMGAQATLGDATSGSRSAMARGLGRGRGAPASAQPESDEPERQGEFDAFQGGDAGIFARGGEYDDEDKEADAIWASIDDHMDSRRRDQREARLKAELEQYRKDNPKITEQFADAKRKLAAVSYDEWDAIPEIGDYTIKRAKQNREFVPAPDTLLQKALAEKETEAYAGDDDGVGGVGGAAADDRLSDLNAVGEGRSSVLGLKLDGLSDSVSGQTVVDPKGYLTSLSGIKISSQAEISDVKKARLLLKSVIGTNPKHAPGWIAAARLEELAGKLQAARSFIQRGCDACPQSQDVWIEAARLNNPETARAILARGVVSLPRSTEIWIAAAKLEETDERKRRVLRKALENIPNSVRLWKAVVDLSSEEDARVLLSRAVECCPQHADLWLALARLETRDKARVVLNKARETLPTEPGIWIAAAKLEEANDNAAIVGRILERAVKSLAAHGVAIDREFWLKEAETAERADPPSLATCREMVRVTISAGVEEQDQKRTFKADAEECARRGSLHTARAIYAVACDSFPGKKSVWVGAANLEKRAKDPEAMDAVLRRAVTHCPRAEILWLMAAKERWTQGDVPGARDVLEEAFAANPDSEDIWLAAFKLEFENREPERARALLAKVREKGAGERVWMKSAIVEREVGDADAERALLVEGLDKFPASWKMWIMLGQLEARSGPSRVEAARDAYAKGCRRCPTAAPLWIAAAGLETALGNRARARAVLEQARLRNPTDESLWLASTRAERAGGDADGIKAADALMAKALQAIPEGGALWAEVVRTAPRPQRKSKSVDALRRCEKDPRVIAAVASLFWLDRKTDKARSWFNRAVTLDPDVGDHWAMYYEFERQHGGEEAAEEVARRCAEANPTHGETWCAVRKRVENWHDDAAKILPKVAKEVVFEGGGGAGGTA